LAQAILPSFLPRVGLQHLQHDCDFLLSYVQEPIGFALFLRSNANRANFCRSVLGWVLRFEASQPFVCQELPKNRTSAASPSALKLVPMFAPEPPLPLVAEEDGTAGLSSAFFWRA